MIRNIEHLIGMENMGNVKDIKFAMDQQSKVHALNIKDIENETVSYDWNTAKNMIVHTRDDLVCLISYHAMIAGRLSNISFYLRFIAIMLGILVFYQIYN